MTPTQRTAALRLADEMDADAMLVGYDAVSKKPVQGPVAWWLYGSTEVFLASEFTPDSEHRDEWVPLFAAQPQRQPLTAEQMTAAVLADETLKYHFALNGGAGPVSEKGVKIFRAVEAAHGIGEPK